MTKQKSNLLQRTIVILLSIVLTVGMVCNTVPANVFAQGKETVQYEEGMTNGRTADIAENIISSDEEWGTQTLEAGIYTINPGVTVTMKGQVTVSGDVTIKGGGKLVRGASEAYFSVSGSNLALQNIEIDGASLSSGHSMAEVKNNGMVTLSDGCRIHHCYKNQYKGSAVYLYQGSAVFEDAIIENCQAAYYGGAVCIEAESSLIIKSGTYQNNRTSSREPCGGGFIYNISSKLEIYGGRFIDNTSSGRGGCIYNTGLKDSEIYLYGGYFQGNKSFYTDSDGKGSGAIFYSSQNTANTIIQLSGNVQFRGDDTAGSGIDGIFLDFTETAQRKAQISSGLKYPTMLYLNAKEGRVIAQGADGYQLQKKDMKKIAFTDVDTSGSVWYAKLDEENNQVILTKTNPGYPLYVTYVSNGAEGNVSDENEYNSGDIVTVQSEDNLSNPDYIFAGWNTKQDGTGTAYQAGDNFEILEDATLYAQWAEKNKVIYDYATNGGNSATQTSVKLDSGDKVDLTPTAIKTGWEFVGWNTDPEAEEGLVSLEMGTKDIILYAIYKKDLTLTFYSGKVGEKEIQKVALYKEDITFTFPKLKNWDIPEVNGYMACGWSDDKSSVSAISKENTSGNASEDMIFYGVYQKEIKISYDANNGSGNVPESQIMTDYAIVSDTECSYIKGSEIVKLQNGTGLSRIGYTFNGWIEGSKTGNAIAAGTPVNPTEDTVYYASWVLADYKVTLHTNGGDSGTNLDSYTYGTGAVLPADWTKKEYTFDGWFDNENLTGTAVTDISDKDTGDKEYWAKWNPVSYTITYNLNGGMTSGNPLSYTIESNDIILNNPTKQGYTFIGWSGTDLTGSNNTDVTIKKGSTGDRTYTANWALAIYKVTLHTNGGDSGTTLDSYTYGTGAALPVDWTKKGYIFDGWFDNENLTGTAVTDISDKDTGDKEYWAKWNPVSYTITYNLNGGMTSGNPLSYTIESDDIILNNPTKEGYTFIGWSGTDLTGNNTNVTITKGSTGNRTYTANWALAVYKVTLHTNGGDSGTTLDSYTYGTGAVLPANWAKKGYTFDGWFDNENLTGTAVTDISDKDTGDKEYWAKWNPVSYTITYNLNGGMTGGNPLSYTIESNDIILNNPTKQGYTFIGWNGTDLTGSNNTDVTIKKGSTGNRTYTANWALAVYKVTLHTNGGDSGTTLDSYTYGTGAVLPLNWTKKGYIFDGWFDNENLTGTAITDISNKDTGDKEYWAKWIDNIPPVLGTLSYSYEPKNLWQWLIGKESLIITVPVTEEGSGADQITYKITPENGSTSMNAAEIKNGAAKIIIDADFKGTISITCTDKAGNISADKTASAEYNGFIIEDNAPQIDFQTDSISVQDEYMAAPAITVSVTDDKDNVVSAGISSVTYKIGNNAETAIQQDFTTSMKTSVSFMIPADKIPAGETVIIVTATDNAGNQNTVTKTIKVHIHSGTLIPATAADCTTSGNMAYYTCSCGKWFSDSECTAEITNDTDIIIKVLGHDFSVIQCDETGHWKKCSRCAEKQPTEAHTEDEGVVIKEATATDTGIKTYKCTVCGYVTRTEIIPATGSGNIIVAAPVISDGAPDGDFVDTLDEVKKAVILTQEERTEIANGIDVNIWLDIKPVTPTENKKTLIEAKKGDYTIGTYMDISMFKQVGDKTPNFVSQLNKKIKISIVIPEQLRNTDNSVERIYRVLHYHDTEAEAEVLTGTYDEKTFTYIFETDRFSTYAIAYKDSKEPTGSNENNNSSTPTDTIKEDIIKEDTIKEDNIPKTNDSGIPEIWLWVLALSGIGVIYFSKMAADNTVKKK